MTHRREGESAGFFSTPENRRAPESSLEPDSPPPWSTKILEEVLRDVVARIRLRLGDNIADEAASKYREKWLVKSRTASPAPTRADIQSGVLKEAFVLHRSVVREMMRFEKWDKGNALGRSNDPFEDAAKTELADVIKRCIDALNDEKRTIVSMRFLDEERPSRIARKLKMPEGTVRDRLTSGTLQVRECIGRRARYYYERIHR